MFVRLRLFPPLSDAAGTAELTLAVKEPATLKTVVNALSVRFGEGMKRHLYDNNGRIIPSWTIFLNREFIPLNQPNALAMEIAAGDELALILNIAEG